MMDGLGINRAALIWVAVLVCGALIGCTVENQPEDAGDHDAGAQRDSGIRVTDSGLPPPVIDPCTPEGMGSTIGAACDTSADCDDGCFCNGVEVCEGGVCVAGTDPCPDDVECTADVCLEELDQCFHDPRHELCTNGNACDGIELCDRNAGCVAGTPPYCNDESTCTVDSCDPAMGCIFQARDLDGDGFTDGRCGGDDCDDFLVDIFPGAIEHCMNRRDDDCDGMRDYNDDDCLPTNDTCDSAVVLPGPGTYSGSTRALSDDYELSCASSGPDAVFRFTLTESQDVTATVSGGGSGAAVSIRPWAECSSGPDEKCSNASPPSTLRRSLPPGDYAIIVKSNSPGAAFDLNLRFGPPTPIPMIDVCDDRTEDLCGGVPCPNLMEATFTGLFAETEDNYEAPCGWRSGAADAVYKFTIDAPKDVRIRASSGASSWVGTTVAITRDCADTSAQLRCITNSGLDFTQRELPPGTYFLIIESSERSSASYQLNVTITDPVPRVLGDACSNPIDLTETVLGGGSSASVDLSRLEIDTGTTCGGGDVWSRDATFTFTLDEMRDLTITTTGPDTWTTVYGHLQRACNDSSTTMRCWFGSGTNAQSWRSVPPGTYYLTLSAGTSSGTLRTEFVTRPPTPIPPNDRCDGAIVLTSGSARRDTTTGFEDDAPTGACNSGPSRPDAFYVFELTERSDVLISAASIDGISRTFYMTVRRDVCGTGEEVACSSGSPGTINTTLDPGVYYLQVETDSSSTAEYRLLTTFFPAFEE